MWQITLTNYSQSSNFSERQKCPLSQHIHTHTQKKYPEQSFGAAEAFHQNKLAKWTCWLLLQVVKIAWLLPELVAISTISIKHTTSQSTCKCVLIKAWLVCYWGLWCFNPTAMHSLDYSQIWLTIISHRYYSQILLTDITHSFYLQI